MTNSIRPVRERKNLGKNGTRMFEGTFTESNKPAHIYQAEFEAREDIREVLEDMNLGRDQFVKNYEGDWSCLGDY